MMMSKRDDNYWIEETNNAVFIYGLTIETTPIAPSTPRMFEFIFFISS